MEFTIDKTNDEYIEVTNGNISFKFQELKDDMFFGDNKKGKIDIADLLSYVFSKKDENTLNLNEVQSESEEEEGTKSMNSSFNQDGFKNLVINQSKNSNNENFIFQEFMSQIFNPMNNTFITKNFFGIRE